MHGRWKCIKIINLPETKIAEINNHTRSEAAQIAMRLAADGIRKIIANSINNTAAAINKTRKIDNAARKSWKRRTAATEGFEFILSRNRNTAINHTFNADPKLELYFGPNLID